MVDFFELKAFPRAIFNFADLCIVLAAALLTLSVYRKENVLQEIIVSSREDG